MHRTAMSVAGERKFRDFRRDNKLDTRQFQMAFRTLRQLSVQIDSSERELDIDATIHDTCENGGLLKMQTRPPRKNNVKVLLLMDSGGSMEYYSNLCSMLFQAATKSNYFKELHTYYFHNSIAKRPKGVQREQARRKYFRAAASPFSSASSVLSPVKV